MSKYVTATQKYKRMFFGAFVLSAIFESRSTNITSKTRESCTKNVVNNIVLLRKRSSHWFLDFYFGYIWSFGIIHVFEGWSISVAILCLNGLEIWANDLKYISLICVFPYWRFTRYWKVWNIINSNFWSLYKQQWFIFTRI